MKILGICGSPKKGNTEFMLRTVLDSAKANGAETELILLRNQNIKHCTGCDICVKTKKCVIKDDMNKLYPKIFSADTFVLGSPSYFNNVSGIMKDFIDRFCPIWEDKRFESKKAFLIAPAHSTAEDAIKAMKEFCDICGIRVIGNVYINTENKIIGNETLIKKLKGVGKKIAK